MSRTRRSPLVVPHITDAIQEWVERVARISVDDDPAEPDMCIIEVGHRMDFVSMRKHAGSLARRNHW